MPSVSADAAGRVLGRRRPSSFTEHVTLVKILEGLLVLCGR